MSRTTFAGCNTTHYVGAVFNHLSGVKSAFCARKTLHNNFRTFINEDAHMQCFLVAQR